jgi:HSP20 family protein
MALVKYNPFNELRSLQEQMNRLLDVAWHREAGEEFREGVWQPPVDIYEDENSVIIKAELPEIDQKDIEVKIEDNTLTLCGERKHEPSLSQEKYYRIERNYGAFQRSFALPHAIDQEKIKASCAQGVLTITMPKKEEAKPKQITVAID